jgi:glyoxylate reductase
MALIFVTRNLPGNGISLLKAAGHEVVVSGKDGSLTKAELLQAVSARPYEAVVSLLSDVIDAEFLSAVPTLKILANYAVGYNNIDVTKTQELNVVVTNTPDVLTDAVAEFTIALMLSITKRIPESERFLRAGKYEGWAPELFLGNVLKGKTLGILGAGRIGREVATLAALGLKMKVIYNDVKPNEDLEASIDCQFVDSVEGVLAEADVVSIHVPLLDSTRHLLSAKRLALMKPTAYLINTSRGPVIDEVALVNALKNGTIRGAALDVFENEPALAPGLAELENVVITPHSASASEETRAKMSEMVAENIKAFFDGQVPPNVVKV